jgi:hypothetical protein
MKKEYARTGEKLPADQEIIERIINGEKELYEQLIRKYNDRLYRIGMSIVSL